MSILTNQAGCTYSILGTSFTVNSNIINFNKVANVMTLTKSVNPVSGKSRDVITFTINVLSTEPILMSTVVDTLIGFTFIPGTVQINGTVHATADPNIGIPINGILPNVAKIVTFNCTVN